jgi:hypothetical protein
MFNFPTIIYKTPSAGAIMWTARVEAMTETGENRLWKVAVYNNGRVMPSRK